MANFLEGIGRFASGNSDSLVGLGLGLMSGDMGQASSGYATGQRTDMARKELELKRQQEEQKRIAAQGLAQKYGLPAEFASDPDSTIAMAKALEVQKRTPKEQSLEQQIWAGMDKDQKQQYINRKYLSGGGTEYGLSPVYGTDAEGKPTILQLGKDGTARQTPLPGGFNIARDPIKVEGPTGTTILDPQTRQQVGFIPKDVAGAARAEATGKADGQNAAAAQNQMNAADDALAIIDQMRTHPGREGATGWQSNFPTVSGSKAAGFENLVEQAKSGAFLTAITQMKGLGALSDAEGRAATAAVNRMNVATSDADFLKAVEDYEGYVRRGRAKAGQIMGRGGAPQSAPAAPTGNKTSSGVSWSVN